MVILKNILDSVGLSYIWYNKEEKANFLKVKLKTTLSQFIQKWNDDLLTHSKCRLYKQYKKWIEIKNIFVIITSIIVPLYM